ncbi:MAG: hypothetical protein F4X48_01430 [Acidimicrobiia bacterium]|nr:hypothetical protein [Acidimicrobiia bacterium]MYC57241.1 hypothetical protein [Acidimicrobiia bacterium]MYI30691.1 hypothetical protein [Acidimicrobiia bacterium]
MSIGSQPSEPSRFQHIFLLVPYPQGFSSQADADDFDDEWVDYVPEPFNISEEQRLLGRGIVLTNDFKDLRALAAHAQDVSVFGVQ